MYLYVRTDAWEKITQKRKQHPPPGDYASTAEAAPGRVGRDEQGGARRPNSTPKGGPHLELWRSRLNTWSKSDFSNAETAWPTYLYTHFYNEELVRTINHFVGAGPSRKHESIHCSTGFGYNAGQTGRMVLF